jgi:hypothetical protein
VGLAGQQRSSAAALQPAVGSTGQWGPACSTTRRSAHDVHRRSFDSPAPRPRPPAPRPQPPRAPGPRTLRWISSSMASTPPRRRLLALLRGRRQQRRRQRSPAYKRTSAQGQPGVHMPGGWRQPRPAARASGTPCACPPARHHGVDLPEHVVHEARECLGRQVARLALHVLQQVPLAIAHALERACRRGGRASGPAAVGAAPAAVLPGARCSPHACCWGRRGAAARRACSSPAAPLTWLAQLLEERRERVRHDVSFEKSSPVGPRTSLGSPACEPRRAARHGGPSSGLAAAAP